MVSYPINQDLNKGGTPALYLVVELAVCSWETEITSVEAEKPNQS